MTFLYFRKSCEDPKSFAPKTTRMNVMNEYIYIKTRKLRAYIGKRDREREERS